MDPEVLGLLKIAQRNEITEHEVYKNISRTISDQHNKQILEKIAEDERRHYEFFKQYTGEELKPDRLAALRYTFISRVLGFTFAIKLMERGEEKAQRSYGKIAAPLPDIRPIIADETEHESALVELLDEERLRDVGAFVLGLNDALVELTGALAGLTLALQNARLVAVTGLITGIAASLSMAASEYLSEKSEGGTKNPLKAAFYTGTAYVFTVIFLVFPFLLLSNVFYSLVWTIVNAIIVVLVFTFYISIAKSLSFKKRFAEMAGISLGVTALTFVIGYLVRVLLEVEV